jgi:hypothetical protein
MNCSESKQNENFLNRKCDLELINGAGCQNISFDGPFGCLEYVGREGIIYFLVSNKTKLLIANEFRVRLALRFH